MRADRLLALLMLLQIKGRMTAHDLAAELEVSERTIYRDLEALGAAGVPVSVERGPGGGCALPEKYRTNLTGLTEPEVRGLFLAAVPGPLADLGLGKAAEAALRKLTAALPAVHREQVEQLRRRIHVDTAEWFRPAEPMPHLAIVQEAVWHDIRLRLVYRRADGARVRRHIEPYGLVAKGNVWYVVGALVQRAPIYQVARVQPARPLLQVYRVSRIQSADLTDDTFTRAADFDLPAFWTRWVADFAAGLPQYRVLLRVAPAILLLLPAIYGEGVRALIDAAGPPGSDGRITLTLTFASFDAARASVLGLGTEAEVLEPPEMRAAVTELAARVVEFYTRPPA